MSSTRSKLTIDLEAVAHNWRMHAAHVAPASCSAVVKANAYGLGIAEISAALYHAGCRDFFVASLQEAFQLKVLLSADISIYILSGVFEGEEQACVDAGFIPVLVSAEMLERWLRVSNTPSARSVLKVDTGMGRLGLTVSELDKVLETDILQRAGVVMMLSHLACADEPDHELNAIQLSRFEEVKQKVSAHAPNITYSLANSSGCTLGEAYHFDMVRPGVALYGARRKGSAIGDLKPVVSLYLDVIQIKNIPAGLPVGYGATSVSDHPRTIAVAAGGYADGIFRSLSNRGRGYVGSVSAPIAGIVSMDSTMFDVSNVDGLADGLFTGTASAGEGSLNGGSVTPKVELLGPNQGLDELALDSNTIPYELLTSLGERFDRVYLGGVLGGVDMRSQEGGVLNKGAIA